MVNGTGGVASTPHAGHKVVGVTATFLFEKLVADFLGDNRLQTCHHVGIGMRPHRRPDDIKSVGWVAAPIAYGFVGGVLEGHVAGSDGNHGRSQHFHLLDVDMLSFNVGFAHINNALHVHQGADGSGGNAMLTGACFGDYACFAHLSGYENLAYGVVDFVRPGMVEILAFEV
jgi:hypothetical protein